VTFEVILNLCWALLGLTAWVSLITRTGDRCWRRRTTVFLAIVALFPCISASDDLATLRRLTLPDHYTVTAGNGALLPLMLAALESSGTQSFFAPGITLFACGLLAALLFREVSRRTPVLAGRSPPYLS
jgi:hypothetical protein